MGRNNADLNIGIEEARTAPNGKTLSNRTVVATSKGSLVGHGEHGYDSVVIGSSRKNQKAVDAAHDAIHSRATAEGIELTGRRTV